jgi:hypothetical protein
MTISSTTVKVSYSGNSSTTVFAYTFKILDDDEIQVIIRTSDGTETIKTKTTHYTVSGVGSAGGGNITFLTAPVTGQTVVLKRNTTRTQETDYVANDPFPANSHEEALDRVTMIAQEIQEELQRAIKLSKTNTMTSTEFSVAAADRANKILAFDTNGEISVTQELGTYRGNWATATSYNGRDLVKDTSTNNIFIVNTAHTSVGAEPLTSNAESAKYTLIVDAQSATNSANAASNHASNSSNFANNSSNSANTSANHSANSSNFANNASNSASNAANSEASVSANANASANSAANSSNFANNSSNSANSASNHSSNSSNFANNSSNSANTSANHASNSSNFANNSSNSANASSNHSANSSNFANNSSNHAANSSNFANASSNHASNSSNHSANSSNFANTSSNHAANSSNFSNNSSNFANTASNSANAANAARDAALAAADNFDDVYLGSKTADPTLDNDGDALTAGDLYYNSVGTVLKYYTGSAWVSITSGGITDLVQDTTPQLGGSLDVNGNSITSTSNGNITLQPNGTGDVVLSADTVKIGDANTDAILTTDGTGDITISTNSGSNSGTVKIFDGTNGNIEITPNGSGVVKLDGLSYPTADGTANQLLKTDGSGNLSFVTPSAGFSGGTITSSAVDITLTSASTQAQSVEMTAADKSVILPDATTLTTKGFPIFVIVNTGLFPFSIKNNSGYILTTVEPTSSIELTLLSNSTSDGIFASDVTNSTITGTVTQSAPFNLVSLPFATVEATTGISTGYFGNQWQIGFSIDKIDTSSFFVIYHKGTSNRDVYGRVISYSGTTITVNSETLLYNGSSTASLGASVCLTSSTTGILLVSRTSNCVAVPFSLSGSTITVGTTSSTFGISTTTVLQFAKPIKVTSTLIAFSERSAATTFKLRTIQYNSGSAPTIGTISSTSITTENDETGPKINRISDTELFMAYPASSSIYTIARIITISGTSAPVYNTANTTSTLITSYLGYGNFINQIDSTNFIVYGVYGSVKYTVSGTTVTHVSDRLFAFYNNFSTIYYMMINANFNNGDYAISHLYTINSLYLFKKDGNHMAMKCSQSLSKSVLLDGLNKGAQVIELDTNTLAVITNNNGSSTLFTTIVKYIGG